MASLTSSVHRLTDRFRSNIRSSGADLEAADVHERYSRLEVDEATPLLNSQLWQQQHTMVESIKECALHATLIW